MEGGPFKSRRGPLSKLNHSIWFYFESEVDSGSKVVPSLSVRGNVRGSRCLSLGIVSVSFLIHKHHCPPGTSQSKFILFEWYFVLFILCTFSLSSLSYTVYMSHRDYLIISPYLLPLLKRLTNSCRTSLLSENLT